MYGVCCRLEGTVDSIPQGLLDGRPASSLVLTHHQVNHFVEYLFVDILII